MLRRKITRIFHENAGHPGRDITIRKAKEYVWWPGMNKWLMNYVQGCAKCQQNKNLTHSKRLATYHIGVPENTQPFQQVSMDLITQLPKSGPYDAILTIVDHGCSRAAVFLPCTTTITGPQIAKLYAQHIVQWFGIPKKIITDRDPRFTSSFGKALTKRLGIVQNLSTAFHPQTDGLAEQKNQWVEQFLRIVARQDDWSEWLPLATAIHNMWPTSLTNKTPAEIIMGYTPNLHPALQGVTNNPSVEQRISELTRHRAEMEAAIRKKVKEPAPAKYRPGDQVWLEATNLKLPYRTPKIAPKRHGPFRIEEVISPLVYRLRLPMAWNIHDVFHMSLLTPYRETDEHGTNFTKPPPDLLGGEEEYEVEAIIGERTFGRTKRKQYLVKWLGYPESDNTWENAEHVHAPQLLMQYRRLNPEGDKKEGRKTKIRVGICLPLPSSPTAPLSLLLHPPLPPQQRRSFPPPSLPSKSRSRSSPRNTSPLPIKDRCRRQRPSTSDDPSWGRTRDVPFSCHGT